MRGTKQWRCISVRHQSMSPTHVMGTLWNLSARIVPSPGTRPLILFSRFPKEQSRWAGCGRPGCQVPPRHLCPSLTTGQGRAGSSARLDTHWPLEADTRHPCGPPLAGRCTRRLKTSQACRGAQKWGLLAKSHLIDNLKLPEWITASNYGNYSHGFIEMRADFVFFNARI